MLKLSRGMGLLASATLLLGAASSAVALEEFTKPAAKAYSEKALAVAGEDLRADAESLCRLSAGAPPDRASAKGASLLEVEAFKPTRVFDDLYYFGSKFAGVTVLKTSAGLILIDALGSEMAVKTQLLPGLKANNLDPADIKYIILTHAHSDHFGGVTTLRALNPNFHLVMSADDWEFIKKPWESPDGVIDPAPKPARRADDISFTGSYKVTLGDKTVSLVETPGHTPGTTSLVYSVRQDGRSYGVMQWGGGFPMDERVSPAIMQGYVNTAKAAKVAVRWGSHAPQNWTELSSKLPTEKGAANPLIMGDAKLGRYLDVLMNCKQAIAAQKAP